MPWRRTVPQVNGDVSYTPSQAARVWLANALYGLFIEPYPPRGWRGVLVRLAEWLDPETGA